MLLRRTRILDATADGRGGGRIVNEEAQMTGRWRTGPMVAVAMLLLGAVAAIPREGCAAAKNSNRNTITTGVVEYARGDIITVAGKTYDLKGARFQDGHGLRLATPPDLRGKVVEVLFRNGKIESVTVYPTLPQ